jgi:biotin-dependent carboxylase-like uncharacterized protein
MGLIVVTPGHSTSVQDLGRPGFRGFGVPEGGGFDRGSLRLANALVGNRPDCATIELTMLGGVHEAVCPLALALAGAPILARLHRAGRVIELTSPQSFAMAAGDRLVFGGLSRGLRAYLAVRGGWRTPLILGSRSSERPLGPGDLLPAEPGTIAVRRFPQDSFEEAGTHPIRLIDGPDGPVPSALLAHPYRVSSEIDRVGLRLDGPVVEGCDLPKRASAPVAPGAVQIAGGRAMILGVAGGTMGGYPHVAHVISADLDRIAQARPFETLRFERVELDQARRFDRERRQRLDARDRIVATIARDGWL